MKRAGKKAEDMAADETDLRASRSVSAQKPRGGKRRLLFRRWQAGTPAGALRAAYVTALGIIAALSVVSHLMTAHIASRQRENAEIAFLLSRQRALMNEITIKANDYYNIGARLDFDFLSQSIAGLEQNQQTLAARIDDPGFMRAPVSRTLYAMYFGSNFAINRGITDFLNRARDYLNYPPEDRGETRKKALERLSQDEMSGLLRNMDVAFQNYQHETQERVEKYNALQFWSMLVVLLVLLIEARFIFGPLVVKVDEYNRRLLRYALEDPMTRLNNRRAFMKRASEELRRAARSGEAFTVAITDLDKFKAVNDTYGHHAGDAVIRHYAGILRKSLRPGDVVGRIGGEEFAIFLPRTDEDAAYSVLERIREKVASTPCAYLSGEDGQTATLSYTASFGMIAFAGGAGLAPAGGAGITIDDLLARADKGLYEAKRAGRNRVVIVPDFEGNPDAAGIDAAGVALLSAVIPSSPAAVAEIHVAPEELSARRG